MMMYTLDIIIMNKNHSNNTEFMLYTVCRYSITIIIIIIIIITMIIMNHDEDNLIKRVHVK